MALRTTRLSHTHLHSFPPLIMSRPRRWSKAFLFAQNTNQCLLLPHVDCTTVQCCTQTPQKQAARGRNDSDGLTTSKDSAQALYLDAEVNRFCPHRFTGANNDRLCRIPRVSRKTWKAETARVRNFARTEFLGRKKKLTSCLELHNSTNP